MPPAPLIDASHAAFIQGPVGISVAACAHSGMPTLVRAIGCRIAPDSPQVTIFLSAVQSARLLKCVRDNGAVAVVFSEPSTHRTVQLKGSDAVVSTLEKDEWEQVLAHRDAFVRELGPLGFDPAMVRTLLSHPQANVVALRFTPTEAYSQTPGPQAGAPLRADA
ncbi:pyridoxamine 5'-phosphate oxidase family protein [Noviherbaspirillum autotrophicum]|uniref:Pyridoxamine 5'-phosphate oxidase putative domain-containing protein n=1 Tax=Noviherbaspirillum autotrophicum TaxID=709839 RepID=A0A0C1Y324_9BURK|nr:pyridoxamine 5'-phosphate oxidase family protein [Noviherbaspirillum autotrophicum]KIF81483.1 hypothetical protein TSA66_12780 [Noviherbaspirillum autotrophicum]